MTMNAANRSVGVGKLRFDVPALALIAGLLAMYGRPLFQLFATSIGDDAQGHSVIIVVLCLWLGWRRWTESTSDESQGVAGPWVWLLFGFACVFFATGTFFNVVQFELGSLVPAAAAAVLVLRGPKQLKLLAFPLLFFLFAVPLPRSIADGLTQPMKLAVSYVAENAMYHAGYPVSRSGVTLTVGPYQMLVADACAGLYTLFTLEALGLLYLNLVKSASVVRNVVMAVLIVPISFAANITRVIVLCLVTFYLGDEAGQGFLHGFAGMVLFMSALMLTIGIDSVVRAAVALGTRVLGKS